MIISNYTKIDNLRNELVHILQKFKKSIIRENRTVRMQVAGAFFAPTTQCCVINEKLI